VGRDTILSCNLSGFAAFFGIISPFRRTYQSSCGFKVRNGPKPDILLATPSAAAAAFVLVLAFFDLGAGESSTDSEGRFCAWTGDWNGMAPIGRLSGE